MTRYFLAALALAIVLAGVQTWRLDRVKADLVAAQMQVAALNSFKERAKEDAQTQSDQCQARVNDARASARRIETIVERPYAVDPIGCPVRDTLGADILREALQPRSAAPQPVR